MGCGRLDADVVEVYPVAELGLALVEESEEDNRGVAVDHGEDEDLEVGRLLEVAREAMVLPPSECGDGKKRRGGGAPS